jgi:hypothetical protein
LVTAVTYLNQVFDFLITVVKYQNQVFDFEKKWDNVQMQVLFNFNFQSAMLFSGFICEKSQNSVLGLEKRF